MEIKVVQLHTGTYVYLALNARTDGWMNETNINRKLHEFLLTLLLLWKHDQLKDRVVIKISVK